MIGIISIGLGNIASIHRMLEKLGEKSLLISSPGQLEEVSKVILPGVGHFNEGMARLSGAGFVDFFADEQRAQNLSVMGICLGMQLLCRNSEEGGTPGLGIVDAEVRKFNHSEDLNLKVPHMGWNVVASTRPNPLLAAGGPEQRFYFVHSYKVVPFDPRIVIGTANYGGDFCAAFQQGTVFGVQFHPEKSHRFGMELIRRFAEL